MAMIAMISGKAAPGVTTSVALLATVWPTEVVVADLDPAGGDLTTGWCNGSSNDAARWADRSVVSFALESERIGGDMPGGLAAHLRPVAGAPNARLLAGLIDPMHLSFVMSEWHRLSSALADLSRPCKGVDVLVDCGRFSPDTPLSLLAAADLVLIAVRPGHREATAARYLLSQLRSIVPIEKLGLAVCATSTLRTLELEQQVGVCAALELPNDVRIAQVFSHGGHRPLRWHRSRLVRKAYDGATRLHVTLNEQRESTTMS
jgi:cellulose biosynthesis protein BcsQ